MDFIAFWTAGLSLYRQPRAKRWRKFFFRVWPSVPLILALLSPNATEAQFAAGFSLSVGEEYSDNIFFEKKKEHDFVTFVTPTLSLSYAPAAAGAQAFTLNISPTGQIFARHSEENNFGRNLTGSSGYTYPYSARLSFHAADTLQLRGNTRTAGVGERGSRRPSTPATLPTPGGTEPLPVSQRLGDFISNGDTLTNHFSLHGNYLVAPAINLSAGYTNDYTAFLDRGGNEISQSIGIRGTYKWGQEHNLYAGYTVGFVKSRDGENSIVHNFDVGDDYFSSTQIKLTPTLTLSLSTGISLRAGGSGPPIANNTSATLIKLWERAEFSAGVRRGLTSSFGVSGVSLTTTLFSDFNIHLTERLSGNAGVEFSLFDTDDVNFKTFSAQAGLQYAVTSWLCSNLNYNHRWRDGGAGASNTDLLTRGRINSNGVSLTFSVDFNLWPNPGLARRGCQAATRPTPQLSPAL